MSASVLPTAVTAAGPEPNENSAHADTTTSLSHPNVSAPSFLRSNALLSLHRQFALLPGDVYHAPVTTEGTNPAATKFFTNGTRTTGAEGEAGIHSSRLAAGSPIVAMGGHRFVVTQGSRQDPRPWQLESHGSAVHFGTPTPANVSVEVEAISDNLAGSGFDQNWYSVLAQGSLGVDHPVRFLAATERRWLGDRRPSSALNALPGDWDRTPANELSGVSYHGRLEMDLRRDARLTITADGSEDRWSEFQQAYFFNLDHAPYREQFGRAFGAQLEGVAVRGLEYRLRVSRFGFESFRGDGLFQRDLEPYFQEYGNPPTDVNALFYEPGHAFDDYLKRKLESTDWSADVRVPWSRQSLLAGITHRRQTYRFFRSVLPTFDSRNVNIDRLGYDSGGNQIEDEGLTDSPARPRQTDAYVASEIPLDHARLSIGLRWERRSLDSEVFIDPLLPFGADRVSLDPEDLEQAKPQNRLTPRLALRLFLGEESEFGVSWGVYHRWPHPSQTYFGPDFFAFKLRTGGYHYVFGNPSVEPERTELLTMDWRRRFGRRGSFSLGLFRRETDDLIGTNDVLASPNLYSIFDNVGVAGSKGAWARVELAPDPRVGVTAEYSLISSEETFRTGAYREWDGGIPAGSNRSDYEATHKVACILRARMGQDDGPALGPWKPLSNTDWWLSWTSRSGFPYTPTKVYYESSQAAVTAEPLDRRNKDESDPVATLDLEVRKTFHLARTRITPFVSVRNLLDRENAVQIWTGTGEPDDTGYLDTEAGQASIEADRGRGDFRDMSFEDSYRLRENDVTHFGAPRQVFLGLRVSLQ